MTETIGYWIDFYKKGLFIRFSVIDNKSGTVIGTIEGFGGEIGVLRIDLASTYETTSNILEILDFTKQNFASYLGNKILVTKAIPSAIERRNALEESGWRFIGKFRDYTDYYQITLNSYSQSKVTEKFYGDAVYKGQGSEKNDDRKYSSLIILRGNSGSGKTTVAKMLQRKLGRETLYVSQDVIRREMLFILIYRLKKHWLGIIQSQIVMSLGRKKCLTGM